MFKFFKEKLISFLVKFYSIPLNIKIIGIIIFISLATNAATIIYIRNVFKEQSHARLIDIGKEISKRLSSDSVDYIRSGNVNKLQKLLDTTVKSYPDVIYAGYKSRTGETLYAEKGKFSPDSDDLPHKGGISMNTRKIAGDKVFDITNPVSGGKTGFINLILSEKNSNMILKHLIESILFTNLAITIIMIAISFLLVTVALSPINNLIEGIKLAKDENYDISLKASNDAKINQLITVFNEMVYRHRMLEKERGEKEMMRKNFAAEIINIQEKERKKLGRELHDEIGQFFAFLKIGLKFIYDQDDIKEVRKNVVNLRSDIDMEIEHVHDLAASLRSAVLDEIGLIKAVEMYVNDIVKKNNINVDFAASDVKETDIPPYIGTNIYRVIQEALLNVIRHSKSATVNIILKEEKENLTGIIEDNGTGFVYKKNKIENMGIYGMEERIYLMGGTFNIESNPGRGTKIIFKIPLDKTDPNEA